MGRSPLLTQQPASSKVVKPPAMHSSSSRTLPSEVTSDSDPPAIISAASSALGAFSLAGTGVPHQHTSSPATASAGTLPSMVAGSSRPPPSPSVDPPPLSAQVTPSAAAAATYSTGAPSTTCAASAVTASMAVQPLEDCEVIIEDVLDDEDDDDLDTDVDLISGLPDELLHAILVHLPSAAAAARTSVLSRRWRGVWAHMPELVLCGSPTPSTPILAFLGSIDAALDSYAAPTLHSLRIEVSGVDQWDVLADRIAPWLRFASQRLAGKLRLRVYLKEGDQSYRNIEPEEELALPICERATEINVGHLTGFVLRPPPTGSFSALTDLMISCSQMDGGELGRVASSPQCPSLRRLHVFVTNLAPVCDICICSESLECLEYSTFNTGKLDINAPMLQEISVSHHVAEAYIVAPMLETVEWFGRYNPDPHQFAVSRRHLQSLKIIHSTTCLGLLSSSTRLMERFDSVKELIVSLGLYQKIAGYVTFLKEMDRLPTCESLVISLMANHHALPALIFHLLRRCSCIRKLKLCLDRTGPPKVTSCSVPDCPCLLPENYRLDGITLGSLEEVEIKFFTGSDEQEEFMKLLLSRCNTVTLKKVDITVPLTTVSSEIKEVVERICSVCHSNSKIQFNTHAKPLAS